MQFFHGKLPSIHASKYQQTQQQQRMFRTGGTTGHGETNPSGLQLHSLDQWVQQLPRQHSPLIRQCEVELHYIVLDP